MSIIIEGLDLPKNKSVIFNLHPDGTISTMRSNNYQTYIAKELSAADVAPVIHAHWVWNGFVYDTPWQCSNCGKFHAESSSYCPECGAKMDESENE